jgi:Spy/CpxP family protein refolding chaperone
MNKMSNKLVVFAVIVLSLSACNLNGQKRGQWSPKDMAKRQTEMMSKSLDLTEEQKESVFAINLKYAEEMKKSMADNKGDREKMRTLRNQLNEKKNADLKETLSSEQFEKYIKLLEERAEEMRNGRKKGRGER